MSYHLYDDVGANGGRIDERKKGWSKEIMEEEMTEKKMVVTGCRRGDGEDDIVVENKVMAGDEW